MSEKLFELVIVVGFVVLLAWDKLMYFSINRAVERAQKKWPDEHKADTPLSADDAKEFRKRVEYEDGLLNSRTGIVLTFNALSAVAVAVATRPLVGVCVAVGMIIIDAIWIFCAFDGLWLLACLIRRMKQSPGVAPVDEKFRWAIQRTRFRMRSSVFIAVTIPIVLLLCWIVGLTVALNSGC